MNNPNNTNVLIFGGSGFIGTNLILGLVNRGLNLYVYDKNASKFLKKLNEDNKIKLIIRDFTKEVDYTSLLRNIDCIIHSIHATIPSTSNKNKLIDVKSNLIPSIKLFEAAVLNEVKKIVFLSSGGKIYGNRDTLTPIKETSKTEPICSYGIIKLTIEKYLRLITNNSKTKFIILRPSNPYGENYFYTKRTLGLINVSMLRIKLNKILTIWGTGENIRDYIYIKDLINAITKSIFLEKKDNYILNIGTGTGRSTMEILDLIKNSIQKTIKFDFVDSRKIDINYNVLNIERTQEVLNWKPIVKIEDGIKKTWEWLNDPLFKY